MSKSVLANLYQRSNIFVPLYIFGEPLGIALLEAMVSKTPIVATAKVGYGK
ncbi:MAG: glycosyltransferase [Candidatus Brockarchaeota archaeon]|nr:glycosyltransferase [Candidatus Brockarchaeota archaeon]MBO3809710.1 glycosyltransferase [Candidatus Brockarchaeota archaeon]